MTMTMLWKMLNTIMTYLQMKMTARRREMTRTRLETMTMLLKITTSRPTSIRKWQQVVQR